MTKLSKIAPLEELSLTSRWLRRTEDKIIVQCHGCFDVLHIGHVRHLQKAKAQGEVLMVTVTADRYVNKGPNRPLFSWRDRAEMLAALECVDYVAVNDAPDACAALQAIRPHFYIKGIDYAGADCQEFAAARAIGAVVGFTKSEKYSSTDVIKRLRA